MNDYIDIVFDGPPGPAAGRFVEIESPQGVAIRIGQWIDRGGGFWALRIPRAFGTKPRFVQLELCHGERIDVNTDRLVGVTAGEMAGEFKLFFAGNGERYVSVRATDLATLLAKLAGGS